MGVAIRRIRLKATGEIYQLRPSIFMPYLVGKTNEVEKALYLRRFGVPYEALAYVFGRNAMYWYRLTAGLGRFSVVGTTVKNVTVLPQHLVADEKHCWWGRKRVYLPTTVAHNCFLGIDVVEQADTETLKTGYQVFRDEALNLKPEYTPLTVNIDGWEATKRAWQQLFPKISVILCFLHFILSVQRHCRRQPELFSVVTSKLWRAYRASNTRQFSQRLRRIREWADSLELESVRKKLLSLSSKAPGMKKA